MTRIPGAGSRQFCGVWQSVRRVEDTAVSGWPPAVREPAGFTLLELLVAMAVFAVLSAIAYGGLKTMVTARDHISRQEEQFIALQAFMTFLGRDLLQVADRPIRDEWEGSLPAMIGRNEYAENYLEFTCNGRLNPGRLDRSSLQRVAYRLQDGQLRRLNWRVLDRPGDTEPFEQIVLENVKHFELAFLAGYTASGEQEWVESWPLEEISIGDQPPERNLPYAVKISLETAGFDRIERIFLTAG